MKKIIRALFGLSPALREHHAVERHADPYQRFLGGTLDAIRQCTSIPELAEYSGNHNGYLREAAIARGVELASPELLPAIAARLNDWVPQVRRAAKNAMLTLLPTMPAPALLAQLPAVDQLLSAQRDDHSAWVREFDKALLDAIGPEPVIGGIRNDAIRIARACFRIARQQQLIPLPQLIRHALGSNDIRIAIDVMGMIGGLPASSHDELYSEALASPFGAVRTIALRELLALPAGDHASLARSCLLDPQSSVRFLAASCLERLGADPDAFYLERLHSPESSTNDMRICLLTLAASGHVVHAACMETYAASPVPRIRMAALMGWVRLTPARKDDIVVLALRDPVARVRKLTLTLIRDFGAYVPVADAIALAQAQHDYRLMLRLAQQDPWTWIDTVARMALQPEVVACMRDVLTDELNAWASRSAGIYVVAQAQQIALLTDPATRADLSTTFPRFKRVFRIIDGVIAGAGRT